jgi:hypothetical protein
MMACWLVWLMFSVLPFCTMAAIPDVTFQPVGKVPAGKPCAKVCVPDAINSAVASSERRSFLECKCMGYLVFFKTPAKRSGGHSSRPAFP